MSDKVKLPRKVIDAIEFFSDPKFDYTKYGVLDNILGDAGELSVRARRELVFKYGEGPCWDVLMKALVNGYEVEETPEDKVRELYQGEIAFKERNGHDNLSSIGAIKKTLELLNIKIEGVNA